MIRKLKLLLLNKSDMPIDRAIHAQKMLSILERVFSSGTHGAVLIYLLERGACTAWLLQVHLNLPEATAYRSLKRLRALKLIVKTTRLNYRRVIDKGGPRPHIWSLIGASSEEIARAIREHYRALSPKYRHAEQVVQTILKDFIRPGISPEVTYRKVLLIAKDSNHHFSNQDIALIASQILRDKGIKVWG